MTPLFLDTEFSGLPIHGFQPKLLSVGVVGRYWEFYAELEGVDPAECTPFVREHVLPLLGGPDDKLPASRVANLIYVFITNIQGPVVLVTDAPEFDWGFIAPLLLDRWPDNLRKQPFPFKFDRLQYQAFHAAKAAVDDASRSMRAHHAYDDACLLRAAWEAAVQAGWKPELP